MAATHTTTARPAWRRAVPLAVAGSLILGAAACGSDGDEATDTPTATTADAGLTAQTAGPVDEATAAAYQKVLDDVRAQAGGDIPGLVAGVWSPEGSWIGTSGTAGEGRDDEPTPEHLTRIGSLTKTMTATILLQLAEEGAVSLDDTIGTYVPGVPNGDVATLRQVADMSSGIPSYTAQDAFLDQLFADPTRAWTPEELVDVVRDLPPDFAPGEGWSYSNTNYVLLGMVIEQVTGTPLAEVFEDRLFEPLGMSSTTFPGLSNAIGEPHLSGLTVQGQPSGQTADATSWNPSEASTAGEVISTLADLKRWADALFTGEGVLTPAMQELRRGSIIYGIPPADSPTSGYGIGIGDKDGWWGHDGQIPGYTTIVLHDYERQATIIVVANSDIPIGGPTGPVAAPTVGAGLQALVAAS